MIGKTLAHYEILEQIGEGGMGAVYRARDHRLDRDVALKFLPAAWADDSHRVRRFEREAKVLTSLEHPNIAAVYGFHEEEALHFFAMELLEGETLTASISSEGLSLDRLLEIAIPLVDAIAYAHDRGVVHRDLKPANIMRDAANRIRVLDFGVASLQESGSETDTERTVEMLTSANEIVGTFSYMAPEQLEGRGVDSRADLFSLGVLLYELATGKRPFHADSAAGITSSILRDEPVPLPELRPDLPADLARVVRRCLAKQPGRRLQTARDLHNELEDIREGIRTEMPSPPECGTTGSGMLADRRMVITAEQVRRLSLRLPRMVGDAMTYLDNEIDSETLVIYLPGLGCDQTDFADLLRMTPFRAVAPSLYGFGAANELRPPLSFTDHNRLVAMFVDSVRRQVRPRTMVLVGYSSGADQLLRIVGSEMGASIRPDGLILSAPTVRPGPGFVSGPFSEMSSDPEDILSAIRRVAATANDLGTWLIAHDYLVNSFRKLGTDIEGLRKLAQDLFETYNKDEFFELFRLATERVPQLLCIFSTDEQDDADYVLSSHIGDNVLGDRFSEEMIVMAAEGHVQVGEATALLPHVEEIVRRTAE